jgi:DNA replication protein DnaC
VTRAVVVAEVVKTQARALKMPGLARAYESLARQAREEKWSHEEYLHEVLAVEVQSRADSAVRQRIRDARFPEMKTLDTFASQLRRASTPRRSPRSHAARGSRTPRT